MEKTKKNDANARWVQNAAPASGGGGQGKGQKGKGKGKGQGDATSLTTKNGTLNKYILCNYARKGVACPDKSKPGGLPC